MELLKNHCVPATVVICFLPALCLPRLLIPLPWSPVLASLPCYPLPQLVPSFFLLSVYFSHLLLPFVVYLFILLFHFSLYISPCQPHSFLSTSCVSLCASSFLCLLLPCVVYVCICFPVSFGMVLITQHPPLGTVLASVAH